MIAYCLGLPVPKEVVVIVTTAQPLPTDLLPPDAGRVNGHPEESRGWQPGWGKAREEEM